MSESIELREARKEITQLRGEIHRLSTQLEAATQSAERWKKNAIIAEDRKRQLEAELARLKR